MKRLRHLLNDRPVALPALLLLVQILVLQALASASNCAAAHAAPDETGVICYGLGQTSDAGGTGAPADCCLDCVSATGCGAASGLVPATAGGTLGRIAAQDPHKARQAGLAVALFARPLPPDPPEPRGPPAFSRSS